MKKPVTRAQAIQVAAAKAAANVRPTVRQQIQAEAIASQRVDLTHFYYSRIRFAGELGEGVITFAPQKRYAFGYQLQREVDGHAGHNATYADTNLLEERSTNRGEHVEIVGIACRPTPLSDSFIMNFMDMFTSVVLRLDNDNVMFFGNPSDIPGSANNGDGPSFILLPDAEESVAKDWQATNKGTPEMDNILILGEPIKWKAEGADAKMDIMFELNEQVQLELGAARAATDVTALGAADNAVVQAWNPPAADEEPGTYVDFFVKLYVRSIGPRSVNK